ncbi:MAG: amidophosphoribosyltransferase [Planctomycetota bacterium]|nr:MAG: amidophosphoribosyltransferase [Planctomycetota bacterium]
MAELFHECGIAAIYHLAQDKASSLAPKLGPNASSRLMPRLLLDIQNRGQLAAGMSVHLPGASNLVETHKDVGVVNEVFHLQNEEEAERLMKSLTGPAAIGHVRYATCGKNDRNYAQPFERHHLEKRKCFAFAFNGQLANYQQLKQEVLTQGDFHLSRDTDTEILLHLLGQEIAKQPRSDLLDLLKRLQPRLDGAYNIVFLNALGEMFVSRDPLGLRPLCWAEEDGMFAAASESVALANLGFSRDKIMSLPPGHAIIIQNGKLRVERYAETPVTAHCFFEWIYFANVSSTLDDRSVYLTRKMLGEKLAEQEQFSPENDKDDWIVVPVPDTAKAAADAMAYRLGIPSVEGLIRNRYVGRTFIEGTNRSGKAQMKYTPLREVLEGKKVLLVEDTIVRGTTMKTLISQLFERGKAAEVHVRVACPPIIAPCFYGIDMTKVKELYAPQFLQGGPITPEIENAMAKEMGATTLKYLPLSAIEEAVDMKPSKLCRACLTGEYPTEAGKECYQLSLNSDSDMRVVDRVSCNPTPVPLG